MGSESESEMGSEILPKMEFNPTSCNETRGSILRITVYLQNIQQNLQIQPPLSLSMEVLSFCFDPFQEAFSSIMCRVTFVK